jgi:hypothetical protein
MPGASAGVADHVQIGSFARADLHMIADSSAVTGLLMRH